MSDILAVLVVISYYVFIDVVGWVLIKTNHGQVSIRYAQAFCGLAFVVFVLCVVPALLGGEAA